MAVANIVVNTKTYTYASDVGGVVTMVETSGGIPTGFGKITFSLREPVKGSPNYRAIVTEYVPVVASVDGGGFVAGQLMRYSKFSHSFEVPATGTTAERTDAALRSKDLLANAQIQGILTTLVRPS
jgi:hypothetical protein